MTLTRFTASDFRCLEQVELEPDPDFSVVYGDNAAGKTSLLEAIAYLGRGRSFRSASLPELLRHGADAFVLHARASVAGREIRLGVQNGRDGLEMRVAGETVGSAAALAECLPLTIIDPEVHELVAGGPEGRRRYLDWIAFHVEHGFLDAWRRFRLALRQRNAALADGRRREIEAFSEELGGHGQALDAHRRSVVEKLSGPLAEECRSLLGGSVGFEYLPGWTDGDDYRAALEAGLERDLRAGSTRQGPQRAELRLEHEERRARKRVSRGQQKLLASALMLAATVLVQATLGRRLLLLLDDPAAELDRGAVERLTARVLASKAQVVATSLEPGVLPLPRRPALFHVEQGRLERV